MGEKATITIKINPRSSPAQPIESTVSTNNRPVAGDFDVTITPNEPVRINLTEHATDVDGDKLSAAVVTQPQFAQLPLKVQDDDRVTVYYQQMPDPETQTYREDSFTYKVNDGKGESNVATVRISPPEFVSDQLPGGSLPQQPQTVPTSPPAMNQAPIVHDVSGETEPDKPVNIMLDASDGDSTDLRATIVKEPDCGSLILNQNLGSVTYTAKSTSVISSSACSGDELSGWQDIFTYSVSDGVQESNVANVVIKIKLINVTSIGSKEAVKGITPPEVQLTGPGVAASGEEVTLVGNLLGLDTGQITDAHFTQERGSNISYSECVRNTPPICSYPSISFAMPSCPVDDNIFRFKISVVQNGVSYDGTRTINLKCTSDQGNNTQNGNQQGVDQNNKDNTSKQEKNQSQNASDINNTAGLGNFGGNYTIGGPGVGNGTHG